MRPIIIGNWKMNGALKSNESLLRTIASLSGCAIGLSVPTPYLFQAKQWLEGTPILWGAQDVSCFAGPGAYTGETSAAMLHDMGAHSVIIGHSERRHYFKEDNFAIAKKLTHAVQAALTPILCIGETAQERQAGQEYQVIDAQLEVLAQQVLPEIIVAYEPVWAIGTGSVASLEQIAAMHAHIHERLLSALGNHAKFRILYGGSVNPDNADAILRLPHVNGALVGGASLNAEAFTSLVRIGSEI